MSKYSAPLHPSAGFGELLAVLMLIVLSENRCGFFTSRSDEAAFDHKAHDIVFLKHPALQEATSDQASSFVIQICCRKHMKYKQKRMCFSPGNSFGVTRLKCLPRSRNETQHQSKTTPWSRAIFPSDYLQFDLFKYAWWFSKHQCTHIKSFITKSKTPLWMLDHRAPAQAVAISHTFPFCWIENPEALFKNKPFCSFISP